MDVVCGSYGGFIGWRTLRPTTTGGAGRATVCGYKLGHAVAKQVEGWRLTKVTRTKGHGLHGARSMIQGAIGVFIGRQVRHVLVCARRFATVVGSSVSIGCGVGLSRFRSKVQPRELIGCPTGSARCKELQRRAEKCKSERAGGRPLYNIAAQIPLLISPLGGTWCGRSRESVVWLNVG